MKAYMKLTSAAKAARGFTLIELMIVVTIVAVLAAIAVPSYTDYVTRSKLVEAFSALSDTRVKMEQYYQDNRRYATLDGGTACLTSLIPASLKYFNITCAVTAAVPTATPPTDESFMLTATGKTGTATASFIYTLNSANARSTTSTYWSITNGTCWVANKSGGCY